VRLRRRSSSGAAIFRSPPLLASHQCKGLPSICAGKVKVQLARLIRDREGKREEYIYTLCRSKTTVGRNHLRAGPPSASNQGALLYIDADRCAMPAFAWGARPSDESMSVLPKMSEFYTDMATSRARKIAKRTPTRFAQATHPAQVVSPARSPSPHAPNVPGARARGLPSLGDRLRHTEVLEPFLGLTAVIT